MGTLTSVPPSRRGSRQRRRRRGRASRLAAASSNRMTRCSLKVLTIRDAVAADDQRAAADDQRAAAALEPPDASAAARAEEEGDEGDEDVERRARAVGARSVGAPSTPTSTPTTSTSTIPSLPPVSLSPDCWWLRQLVLHSYASGGLRPSASSTSPASSAHGGDGGGARGGWEREEEVVNVAAASGRAQALDDPSHNGALPRLTPPRPAELIPSFCSRGSAGKLALSSLPAAVSGGGSVSDSVGGLTSSLLLHAWLEAPTAHLAATSAARSRLARRAARVVTVDQRLGLAGAADGAAVPRHHDAQPLARGVSLGVMGRAAPEGGSGVGMSVHAGGAAAGTRLGGGSRRPHRARDGRGSLARGGRDGGNGVVDDDGAAGADREYGGGGGGVTTDPPPRRLLRSRSSRVRRRRVVPHTLCAGSVGGRRALLQPLLHALRARVAAAARHRRGAVTRRRSHQPDGGRATRLAPLRSLLHAARLSPGIFSIGSGDGAASAAVPAETETAAVGAESSRRRSAIRHAGSCARTSSRQDVRSSAARALSHYTHAMASSP